MDEKGFTNRLAYSIILKIQRPIATNVTNIFKSTEYSLRGKLANRFLPSTIEIFPFQMV